MTNVELLLSLGGIMVAITAGVVIPVGTKFGAWMGSVTATLAEIRVNQGRHDKRIDHVESVAVETKAAVADHETRLRGLETG